jgi:hypothetical protein
MQAKYKNITCKNIGHYVCDNLAPVDARLN